MVRLSNGITELSGMEQLKILIITAIVFAVTFIAVFQIKDENDLKSASIFVAIIPLAVVVIASGFIRWSEYNSIVNTPISRPSGVAAGFVEVYGEAAAKEKSMLSPFGGQECVFYRFTAGTIRSPYLLQGDSGNFLVKDESGIIEVDPQGAEFNTDSWKKFYVKKNEKNSNVDKFIEEMKDKYWLVTGLVADSDNRVFSEYVIKKGQKVFVTGTAVPGYEIKSDMVVPKIVIKKGKQKTFFYISNKEEREVLADMRKQAVLFIAGGGLVALIGVWYILLKLNML
jgi:hypothetical protein